MEFCPDCRNLLSLKIKDGENGPVGLSYNCHNCSYHRNEDLGKSATKCVYNNPENVNMMEYYVRRKDRLRHDPTIPHINSIPCPNKECPSNSTGSDAANDIFYVTLNKVRLSNLYVCNNCMTHWTNK